MPEQATRAYRAFFSYARADDRIAGWLHRALDAFRTPSALVGSEGAQGPVPAKLHPIFRDRTDMSGGGHLTDRLRAALEDSAALIVLCSPAAAKSAWVNEEIVTFQKLGREDSIFPVIADGEPDSSDPDTECFPPALRGRGLLAADLREIRVRGGRLIGDGREGGRLKLIAGLLGVPLDALAQREQRRQRLLIGMLAAATVVFAGLAIASVAFGFLAQRNADLARASEHRSFNALTLMLAERAWQSMGKGDYPLAARYALVGWRVAPANEADYRIALGRLMHDANESRPLTGHTAPVTIAAFSPDGKRFVTAAKNGGVILWDGANGRQIAALSGHRGEVVSAAFTSDSARLLTASQDGLVWIWESASGEALQSLRGLAGLRSAAISADGARIVTAGSDARVWDAASGAPIAALEGHGSLPAGVRLEAAPGFWGADERGARLFTGNRLVNAAAFSPDGSRVATASPDGAARVWDASSGRQIALMADGGLVDSAVFSPDGRRVLTVSTRGARLWDPQTGRELLYLGPRDFQNVQAAVFSADGTRILTTHRDYHVRVWDAVSGRMVSEMQGHTGAILSAAFDRGARLAVTASEDGAARVWSVRTGEAFAILRGHEGPVRGAVFSPDGERVVTVSDDGAVRLWGHATGRVLNRWAVDEPPVITETFGAFSRDGAVFASTHGDFVRVWHMRSGRELLRVNGPGSPDNPRDSYRIHGIALSADGARLIISRDDDRTARILQVSGGREIAVLRGHERTPETAEFSPDGARVLTMAADDTARIWDARTGRELAVLAHEERVGAAAFSADGAYVATASGKSALIWNASSGDEIATLKAGAEIVSVAFSADRRRLALACADGTVRLMDVENRRELIVLRGHGGPVGSAVFSPDGTRVASASADSTVRIWDAATGREITVLSHDSRVRRAAFSADGARLFSVAGHVAVEWDVSRLTAPMEALARSACSDLLLPRARRFSDAEIGADPLIRTVWLRDRPTGGDVCEGVRAAASRRRSKK